MRLDDLPRLGLVDAPSPVTELPELADELGLDWLGLKRDDLLPRLHGGTKVRKLDGLLATPALAASEVWTSVGAIGSGHLVAMTAAAAELGHRFRAHLFWEPPIPGILENLAFTASGPTELRYTPSRVGLALRHPTVLLARRSGGAAVVPPGATTPAGMVGLVRAAFELRDQIDAGELPRPDRLYVPLGSGGTVAGLALGLGLCGLRPRIHAVAAVERPFATRRRVRGLIAAGAAHLGVEPPALPEIVIDRGQLGRRYGVATPASLAASARLEMLEPIYSGKAMASLLAAPGEGRVLFWVTPRRAGPLPHIDGWMERLPGALRRRLDRRGPSRRLLLGAAATALIGVRVTGYPAWRGARLTAAEAALLLAAAEALFPELPAATHAEVPRRVDAYVRAFPGPLMLQLHAALNAVEHGTALGGALRRLTRLSPRDRAEVLTALQGRGGVQAELYRAVRDLCALALYQQPATWPPVGYGGPWVGDGARPDAYAALTAPAGATPRGWEAE